MQAQNTPKQVFALTIKNATPLDIDAVLKPFALDGWELGAAVGTRVADETIFVLSREDETVIPRVRLSLRDVAAALADGEPELAATRLDELRRWLKDPTLHEDPPGSRRFTRPN